MTSIQSINEAFEAKIAEKGTLPFSATKLTDPHVKKVIAHASKALGVPESEIIDDIKKEEDKFKEIAKKAPFLYSTIVQNIIESTVFNLLEKVENAGKNHRIQGAPDFDQGIFLKLVSRVKSEHDQFFPLRNFTDHKKLKNTRIVVTPSDKPENKHLNAVKTACATPKGEFAFYKPFMQKLIDFAWVKGIKGNGKKWISNGGDIPDEYAYIEFLIIHEFMHFTYADFHYHKIYKVSPKIINYVGDFRSNYLLVKSGYHQLPMGLFSDDINYDRQKSYKEMIDIVKKEMEKLKPDEKEDVEKQLDDAMDDHGEPGDGDPSDSETGDPSDGDPSGNKKPGDGDGEYSEDDVEKSHKEVEKKMSEKSDKGPNDMKPSDKKGNGDGKGEGSKGGTGAGSNSSQRFDYTKVKPTFTWDQLLKKLLSTAGYETEETFQKPAKSSVRNYHIARQTGAGAVKPAEITTEAAKKLKICFVIDSSGSMTHAVAKVYANIENLLKTNKKALNSDFYLVKFSATHVMYRCNIGKKSYAEVTSTKDTGGTAKSGNLKTLFTESFGSTTNFNEPLIHDLEKLNAQDYNLILITDSDILDGTNLTNFFKLYAKTKKNLFVMADSKSTYHQMLQRMNQIAKNITHLD